MRCQAARVKSGDELESRPLCAFVIDDFLREIEAAAALNLTPVTGIRSLGRATTGASGLADLALRDAVADADDHESQIHDNATHSQLDSAAEIFPGDERRRPANQDDMREQLSSDRQG